MGSGGLAGSQLQKTTNEEPRSIRYSQPVPSTGSPYKAGGCISFNISTCLWRSSSFKTTLYNPPAVFWPCIVLYLICLATVMYMHALCRLNGNPQERLVESVAKVQSLHAFAEFCRHCWVWKSKYPQKPKSPTCVSARSNRAPSEIENVLQRGPFKSPCHFACSKLRRKQQGRGIFLIHFFLGLAQRWKLTHALVRLFFMLSGT